MKESIESQDESVEMVDNTPTEAPIVTPSEEQKEKDPSTDTIEPPKKVSRKKKVNQPEEVIISPDPEPSELEKLKAELQMAVDEKMKLEAEKTALNETISKLQEEVKITPQKLASVVKQMGIAPLSVSRDNPQAMTLETYNSMTDSARREWQRTHRADYLAMMHKIKISQ